MTLESRLVSYDWDNQFQSFQDATMKGSFKPLCWTAQSTLIPVSWKYFVLCIFYARYCGFSKDLEKKVVILPALFFLYL